MIFDALLTFIIVTMLQEEAIKAVGVFALMVLIRTCYLVIAYIESTVDREDDYNVK